MSKRPSHDRQTADLGAPFSRPLEVHTVPEGGLETAIEATDEERADIAAALGLVDVGELAARFRIERRAGGRLALDGEVEAAITQICVVSLEPFDSRMERPIAVTFAPQAEPATAPDAAPRSRRRESTARDMPPVRPVVVPGNDDQEDPPDPIIDGRIDLGALALEFLTLSLDLYPRKPGVHFADVSTGDKKETDSPFATLQRLKDPS